MMGDQIMCDKILKLLSLDEFLADLMETGQDQDSPAAGTGRPCVGPGPPQADRRQPGEEAEEV